ncbi:hypothetical protein HNQ88_001967 [Aureibacter tunicatorum]|uniref:Uncharacterized protein n=1 Tax=Aureibacter tunicatorum TaxID=866807 RepID=A0AAE4BSK1_9BACT|nr:hypothetical protein [Aureibacter tunicatorum]
MNNSKTSFKTLDYLDKAPYRFERKIGDVEIDLL